MHSSDLKILVVRIECIYVVHISTMPPTNKSHDASDLSHRCNSYPSLCVEINYLSVPNLLHSLTHLWLSNLYPFEHMCNLLGVTVLSLDPGCGRRQLNISA